MGKKLLGLGLLFSLAAQAVPVFKQTTFNYRVQHQTPFNQVLKDLLSDLGSGTLHWQTDPGLPPAPPWLTITDGDDATMSGTPTNPTDVKTWTFGLRVNDDDIEHVAAATVIIEVFAFPQWNTQDLNLGETKVGQVGWNFDLKPFVENLGGKPLTFNAVSGKPNWMNLDSATGILSGIPALADVGPYNNVVFEVSTADGANRTTARGTVVANPPTWTSPNLDLGITFVNQTDWSFDLKPFVQSTPGDTLTFQAISGKPGWMQLNPATGILTGTPGISDVGNYLGMVLQVSSAQGSSRTEGRGTVVALPQWTSTDIDLGKITAGNPNWSFSLKPFVTNPSAMTLTFAISGHPAWMHIDAQTGVLSGVPQESDVGPFSGITVSVQGNSYPAHTTKAHGEVMSQLTTEAEGIYKVTVKCNEPVSTDACKKAERASHLTLLLGSEDKNPAISLIYQVAPPPLQVTDVLYSFPAGSVKPSGLAMHGSGLGYFGFEPQPAIVHVEFKKDRRGYRVEGWIRDARFQNDLTVSGTLELSTHSLYQGGGQEPSIDANAVAGKYHGTLHTHTDTNPNEEIDGTLIVDVVDAAENRIMGSFKPDKGSVGPTVFFDEGKVISSGDARVFVLFRPSEDFKTLLKWTFSYRGSGTLKGLAINGRSRGTYTLEKSYTMDLSRD